jgi:hypothetical protein
MFPAPEAACELLNGWPTADVALRRSPESLMRKMLVDVLRRHHSEPMSRTEMWLGIITVYLVLGAYFMGHVTSQTGTAEKTVAPVTNRA